MFKSGVARTCLAVIEVTEGNLKPPLNENTLQNSE